MKYIIALMCVLMFTACADFKYKRAIKKTFAPQGWVKYQHNDPAAASGYQLIEAVKTVDSSITDIFEVYGYPDYVYAPRFQRVNLAYINKCQVLVYLVKTQGAPRVFEFSSASNLLPELREAFVKNCVKQ
ncbi:hypothetical protein [Algibacillus agarilyticus]|uniref:hypothetical protein n=1 Tax=Algibacillus agarilyticus TaxID=2234133 RepID=UPI000DD02313|nr:hypothetical protein [Algibacillus agarilyticus]